jgi:hypothetical protein
MPKELLACPLCPGYAWRSDCPMCDGEGRVPPDRVTVSAKPGANGGAGLRFVAADGAVITMRPNAAEAVAIIQLFMEAAALREVSVHEGRVQAFR